jgi:hypothetical protein
MLRIALLGALAVLIPVGFATAQEEASENAPAPRISVANLLGLGFEIKAMSFVNGAVVLILQRGTAAYVCETDPNGQSRLCVQLQ